MTVSTDIVGRRLRPRYHRLRRAMSGGQLHGRRRRSCPMPPIASPTVRSPHALPGVGRVGEQIAISGEG
jgi:hypothetical protein